MTKLNHCAAKAYAAVLDARLATAKERWRHRAQLSFAAKVPLAQLQLKTFVQHLRDKALHKLDEFTKPRSVAKASLATVVSSPTNHNTASSELATVAASASATLATIANAKAFPVLAE